MNKRNTTGSAATAGDSPSTAGNSADPTGQPQTMARLRWRCRRGMGELDQLLGRFLEHHYAALSVDQRTLFDVLLAQEDDRLWALFLGREQATPPELQQLIDDILARTAFCSS